MIKRSIKEVLQKVLSIWSHVKEKTKSKSSIGDLKDANGEIKTDEKDKDEILNAFFALVFTVEGDSELPDFEPNLNEKDNIDIINIKPERVLKQFKNLNVSKSRGSDNCHPFFIRECAEEIYLPLSDPFSTADVQNDWKKANLTCIFKKGNKQEPGNYRPVTSITDFIFM